MSILGIDVGGSGIKGALVDVDTGELVSPRYRVPTPDGGKPADIAKVVQKVVEHFEYTGPIGCSYPGVVLNGVVWTAANVHESWVGVNANKLLSEATGCPSYVTNDADAAGIAEMKFGAGRDIQKGVVLVLTLGTGIGTALFTDGHLVPNLEFGHLQIRGKDGEKRASDATRQRQELSWKKYAKRLNEFLVTLENLFWPDLFIISGGISKEHDKYFKYLDIRTKIVPAQMLNQAGIVGTALYAQIQNSAATAAKNTSLG
jgi:polyphosphate glucokinase